MANVLTSQFYKRAGVRQLTQLTSPPVRPIEEFVFPKSSIYHHLNLGLESTETLSFDSGLFAGEKGNSIYVHPVTDLVDTAQEAKKQPIALLKDIYSFKSNNKQTRLIMAGAENSVGNPNFPLVYDYTYVEKQYRYNNTKLTEYHKWYNRLATAISNIKTCRETYMMRDNYLVFDIPDNLPPIAMLQNYADKNDNVIVTHFTSPASYFIKEFYLWIKSNKQSGLLSQLGATELGFVNVVFTYKSKAFTVLNLGFMSNLLGGQVSLLADENEVLRNNLSTAHLGSMGINNARQVEPVWLGRYFMSFLVRVQHASFFDEVTDEELTDETVQVGLKQTTEDEQDDVSGVNEDLVEADLVAITKASNAPTEESVDYSTFASEDLVEPLLKAIYEDTGHESELSDIIEQKAEAGYLSAVEYKQAKKLLANSANLKDPDGVKETLLEAATVTAEDLQFKENDITIADNPRVADKRMLTTKLKAFNRQYITKIMDPNIKACVVNLQRAGIFIQDYTIEHQEDVANDYKVHVVKLKPIDGNPSTIRFKIPTIDEEGNWKSSNQLYSQRSQLSDLPIRKIASNIVTLSSYYGKLFISRAEYVANSESVWIKNQLLKKMAADPNNISAVDSPSFDMESKLPKCYTNFSQNLSSYSTANYALTFDYKARYLGIPESEVAHLTVIEKSKGVIYIGHMADGSPLFLDGLGGVHSFQNELLSNINSSIYTFLELNVSKMPNEFAEMKVGGKAVPVVVVLGKLMGLENTIRLFKGKVEVVSKQKRIKAPADRKIIEFKDSYLLYDSSNVELQMVLSALIKNQAFVKRFSISDFNMPDVYFSFLEHLGLTARQYREIELLNQLFVDPITKLVLEEMNEPVTFIGLLKRSVELLKEDDYPRTNDGKYMRVRSYERVPGIMYKELIKAVRAYKGRTSSRRLQIELNPYAVSTAIQMDTTVSLVAQINPIEDLKLKEVTTLTGEGGRSKDAISAPARTYNVNQIGTISEATVDSGDVGVTAYMSANPRFNSVLGISTQYNDTEELDPVEVYSTSMALSAFAGHDDPKRMNNSSH